MASPFANLAPKGNLFSSQAKGKAPAPPEDVTLIVAKAQVVTALIPYGTRNAAAIRAYMHANVVTEEDPKGQRYFIFRSVNGWTTIHLQSTEQKPMLTGDPITVLKTAWRKFNECPQVGSIYIKWENTTELLGYDDIDGMCGQFDPLPGEEAESDSDTPGGTPGFKTDAEVLSDKIDVLDAKLDTMHTQLVHVVDALDKIYNGLATVNPCLPSTSSMGRALTSEQTMDEAEAEVLANPATAPRGNNNAAGKRKARK